MHKLLRNVEELDPLWLDGTGTMWIWGYKQLRVECQQEEITPSFTSNILKRQPGNQGTTKICDSETLLQSDYYNRGHLDKVDQLDYRKIRIFSKKVSCQS